MEGLYNFRELYTIPEESSQVDHCLVINFGTSAFVDSSGSGTGWKLWLRTSYLSQVNVITVIAYGDTTHRWITSPILIFWVVKQVTRFKREPQQAVSGHDRRFAKPWGQDAGLRIQPQSLSFIGWCYSFFIQILGWREDPRGS
ncbi:hypothetical protein I308_103958 [Cryptococcus tetragattii IND107]|uniref:Uncharacterized protein n=1 Tax=Cryptococcus tetragattii IND107 TaxID=1296105 RepID=A0ABR3BRR9_9TREE